MTYSYNAEFKRIVIEDTSDCAACTKREEGELELLVAVKCDLISDVQCPECGRTVAFFVPSEG